MPRPDPRRVHPDDGGPLAGVHGLSGGPSQTGWRGTGGGLGDCGGVAAGGRAGPVRSNACAATLIVLNTGNGVNTPV